MHAGVTTQTQCAAQPGARLSLGGEVHVTQMPLTAQLPSAWQVAL